MLFCSRLMFALTLLPAITVEASSYFVSPAGTGDFSKENPGSINCLAKRIDTDRRKTGGLGECTVVEFLPGRYHFADTNRHFCAGDPGGERRNSHLDFYTVKGLRLVGYGSATEDVVIAGTGDGLRAFSVDNDASVSGMTFCGFACPGLGGAVYGGSFSNCVFRSNRANNGGAIAGRVSAVDCVFRDNVADKDGGAVFCPWGGGVFSNCTFTANVAVHGTAGALMASDAEWRTPSVIADCEFDANRAQFYAIEGQDRRDGIRQTSICGYWKGENVRVKSFSKRTLRNARKGGAVQMVLTSSDGFSGLLEKIREVRDDEKPFTVILEDGIYAVSDEIRFAPNDHSIVIRARNPGKAIVVGGVVFSPSKTDRHIPSSVERRLRAEAKGRIRRLPVPRELTSAFKGRIGGESRVSSGEAVPRVGQSQGSSYPSFVVDGKRMEPACWPNDGQYWKMPRTNLVAKGVVAPPNGRARQWVVDTNRVSVSIWGFTMNNCSYAQTIKYVSGRDADGNFTFSPGWGDIKVGARFRFVNVLEEVDVPGEWCYDSVSQSIYFIPPDGFGKGSYLAVGTMRPNIFRIEADNIAIEGLAFSAKLGLPVISIENFARGTQVNGCTFSALDGYAIFAAGRGTRIKSCDFKDLTGCGVHLAGGSLLYHEKGGNSLDNCRFERCCLMRDGWAHGCAYVDGYGNSMSHCYFTNCVEHAFDYAGFGHVIEYNVTRDVSKEFEDSAAVYSPGGQRCFGNVFRYNDIGSTRGYCNAWYADDCSSGHVVYGNVFRDFGHCGIFIGGGRNNTISNNLVTAGGCGLHIDNRGLWWEQYSNQEKLHRELVRRYDYQGTWVRENYPELSKWYEDYPKMFGYYDNQWINNVVLNCAACADLQECRKLTIDEKRLVSKGNVYVMTTGGGNMGTWRIGGIVRAHGTKESPSPVRDGDNASIRSVCPGWRDIPFSKMGLYVDKWRKSR